MVQLVSELTEQILSLSLVLSGAFNADCSLIISDLMTPTDLHTQKSYIWFLFYVIREIMSPNHLNIYSTSQWKPPSSLF